MAALAQKATLAGLSSRTLRSARPCLPVRPAVRPCVAARAAKSGEAFDSEQLKKNFDNLTADLQKKWEKNEEKPATVAIGVAALLALITVSSVVDTIDRIPVVSNIIELIGICVSGWFTYRYLVFGPDREELFNNIKSFINKVYNK